MRVVRSILVVLVLFCTSAAAFTEEGHPYAEFPRALGAAYGPISGTGLHYHRWIGEIGVHVAGGALYLPPAEAYFGTTLDYNLGVSIQRRVYGDRFGNWLAGSLYVFAGGNHRGYIPLVPDPSADPEDYSVIPGSFTVAFTAGVGIGIELVLFNHFSVPLEFGYGGTWIATEPDPANAFLVDFYFQSALRYRY